MIWRSQAYLLSWRHNRVEEAEAGYGNQRVFSMSMQVYGFWRSIASFRVRVALRLKGLPFEEVQVDILSGEQFKPGATRLSMPSGWCRRLFTTAIPCSSHSRSSNISTIFS